MKLERLSDAADKLETGLRLQTHPIALKMVKAREEMPEDILRPLRDFGHHLSTCQVFAMARRDGITMAQQMEDMWCVEPVLGYGLAEAPEYFLAGNNRYPDTARTPEAGMTWAQGFPRLEVGKYKGVITGPAEDAGFEPDLILVYCNSAQLTQLLNVKNWMDGRDVMCRLSGHAACVYSVVLAIQTGQWQVTAPCGGDRTRAMARDDEMIVSFPVGDLRDVLDGLTYMHEQRHDLPLALTMMPEYPLRPSYVEIGRRMGMDWVRGA